MPNLTVALDSSLRRDIQFSAGDDLLLGMVVYQRDGDPAPVVATNLALNLSVPADNISIPMSGLFVAPTDAPGRRNYVIKGDVGGYTRTLAYGVLEILGADGYSFGNLGIGFASGGGAVSNPVGPDNGMIDEFGDFIGDEFGNFMVY